MRFTASACLLSCALTCVGVRPALSQTAPPQTAPPQMAPPQSAPPGTPPATSIVEVSNMRFYSAFWMNLHHTLFAAAWAQRPAGTRRSQAGALPAPLTAAFTDVERAAWNETIAYYDRALADRSLLFDDGMSAIKDALVAEDLASAAIGQELRAALERAAPVYRKHFWEAHDRANRVWIEATTGQMRTIAGEVIPRLERLYDRKWFDSPARIDVVWIGDSAGAYTTVDPTHATISSDGGKPEGWTSVELVFHEMSHGLVWSTIEALSLALGDRVKDHRVLWHVIQFYMTGTAVQQVLRARGIDYTPYVYSTGLFDRVWGRYRAPIEEHWAPYVNGTITRAQAIERTVAALGSLTPR